MSIKQINKVFNDTNLKGNEKLLMLALADNTNDSGVCFPSWNSLITKTSMSKGSISKWLKKMEDNSILFRVSRNRKNGSRTSNKYLIYPYDNKPFMDEEDYLLFEHLFIQSSEVELPIKVQKLNYPSSEVELPKGGQSSEVEHLEPSLNSNHQSKPSLNKKVSLDLEVVEAHKLKINILEFIQHRKEKKNPFSQLALSKFINKVNKFLSNGNDVIELIDNSITAGYTDIYEPRNKINTKQQSKPNEKTFQEVLDMFLYEIKKGTDYDYVVGNCKSMLNWGLHKDFDNSTTKFKHKMLDKYGYEWQDGLKGELDEQILID